ncbi:hypothetical protein KGQ20_21555 [Catenulispora sp. NF23]|uniref:Uncharacterized protein n=1 Tax=Catenulispora pinistramenti TaxID=2705254 RepID=A0ABS5KM00_9ACTN|nr:hypothetical protein [Catenulispora pinistramenti]MBS2535355.1 hypothetical protein [Catenulispora pinistramenti]MBS2547058.1 hypothetical protein [Catenulispora pinistramenti]
MGRGWTRRGPWWLYVLVVGGLNVARQIAFPPSRVGSGMTILLFFVVLAVSFVVIEALRRTRNRADRPR